MLVCFTAKTNNSRFKIQSFSIIKPRFGLGDTLGQVKNWVNCYIMVLECVIVRLALFNITQLMSIMRSLMQEFLHDKIPYL